MLRRVVALVVSAFLVSGLPGHASPSDDSQLVTGIELVRAGDFEGALHALSKAARALEGEAKRAADLTQAYVYLGVAYLELGHTQMAHTKFTDALSLTPGLQLDTAEFSRKTLRAFELARQQLPVRRPPAPGVRPSPPPAAQKKGRSKALPILLVAGGGGAAALVAAQAGGSTGAGTPSPMPQGTDGLGPFTSATPRADDITLVRIDPPVGSTISRSSGQRVTISILVNKTGPSRGVVQVHLTNANNSCVRVHETTPAFEPGSGIAVTHVVDPAGHVCCGCTPPFPLSQERLFLSLRDERDQMISVASKAYTVNYTIVN